MNIKPETINYVNGNISRILSDTEAKGNYIIQSIDQPNGSKTKYIWLHKTEKLLHHRRNNDQNKKIPHRLEKDISKSLVR